MNLRKYPLALIIIPILTLTACLSTLALPTNTQSDKSPEATDSKPLATTQQVTSAPTPTSTVTPTPAPTKPPTEKPFVWAGDWNMHHTTSGNTYPVTLVQSGKTISGTSVTGDPGFEETYNLKGVISSDGMSVSGTWDNITFGTTGTFKWRFVADNGHQFIGSTDSDAIGEAQDWCGYRTGAPQPDPCMWP
jgi:hypothetical protein